MNKTFFLRTLAAIMLIFGFSSCGYNGLVALDEEVQQSWGHAKHEEETLTKVVEARAKATSTTIDASQLDEAALAKFQQQQDALSSALSKLMVVSERYPELKANEQFKTLQDQLEGTENRIAIARQDFNKIAQEYNTEIRQFPKNIVASIMGFKRRPYFAAKEGSDVAPQVDFSK